MSRSCSLLKSWVTSTRCVLSSLKTNGKPGNRRAGLVGGADRDPAHPAVCDVVADLEAEGVAIEGQGCVRVVMREEGRVNGDVHGGHSSCGSVTGATRFLIGLVTCFAAPAGARGPSRGRVFQSQTTSRTRPVRPCRHLGWSVAG